MTGWPPARRAPDGHRSLAGLRRLLGQAGILVVISWLSACAAGGASGIPMVRATGWFRYLNGDDLRAACAPGSPDRYRFVYNAVWGEQVRAYEIVPDVGSSGAAHLESRILFPENLSSIDLRDPLALWSGKRAATALRAGELRDLKERLGDSGFRKAAPAGMVLPSDGYYWVAQSCEGGTFHFNAWAYPSPAYAAISFDDWLFRRDRAGVAVEVARERPLRPVQNRDYNDTSTISIFDLTVGENGLVGVF